ncbi:cytochrome c [Pseudomonas lactucae]|uniref:cytochrome c n=1 Tax=Pseudomonas lactucae TaxID=2813360 RepID=UPI002FCD1C2B
MVPRDAMPYSAYVKFSDQDMHDLWAYMQTVPAGENHVVSNQLPFPLNIRLMMVGWNLLFFDNTPFKPVAGVSEQINRGEYLVDGLGHCAACHTSKNFLGGDQGGAYLQRGKLAGMRRKSPATRT